MDRSNFFHGQVVMEDELDEVFDDVEDAERNLAIEGGACQAAAASTPNANALGGIMAGLVVTAAPGAESLNVTIGVARDELGRRTALTHAATVLVSLEGACAEGVYTDASGDGALITGSCGIGARIIASLFIVYDEHLSEPKTDALGAALQYRLDESFHFDIRIAGSFPSPPVAPPGRAALVDGKVLLADVILTHNGGTGTMQVVQVMNTSAEWDVLGAQYNTLDGRRGNVVALDQAIDFPMFATLGHSIRTATAKEAIWALARMLQGGAGLPGASFVGAAAAAGAATFPYNSVLSLTAGSAHDQLLAIQGAINGKVDRGGGLVKPGPGVPGFDMSASDMTVNDQYLQAFLSKLEMDLPWAEIGTRRGQIRLSPVLYDDFLYCPTGAGQAWAPVAGSGNRWGLVTSGTGGQILMVINEPGGVLQIDAADLGGGAATHGICSSYFSGASYAGIWKPGAATRATCYARLAVNGGPLAANRFAHFGLIDLATGAYIEVLLHQGTAKAYLMIHDTAGADSPPVEICDIVADTWYTFEVSVLSNTSVEAQEVEDGPSAVVTSSPVGSFGTNPYALICYSEIDPLGLASSLYLDTLFASDQNLRGA